jgi:NADH-quinone oxidoreductase subunit L
MAYFVNFVLFCPLVAAIINGLFCKRIQNNVSSVIGVSALTISFLSSIVLFITCGIHKQPFHFILGEWINFYLFSVNWGIYVDQLTAIMFVLITTVSLVVHVYSVGYMSDDDNFPKFLSYLSLFTFFMLSLVSADNFLQLFFGWEGVGLCSYLLIGYYFHKSSANDAAIKAFLVNRVSDLFFILGMVILIVFIGSLEFKEVFKQVDELVQNKIILFNTSINVIDIVCCLLFVGCMGKSAQIGLHVWLPDAMEGPTPVSALIHAATMVTAGVFLLARCSILFENSPVVLHLITVVGAVTCLFAAVVAVAQTDIKKIIAYSTCSQLGYMFFACGVSAYHVGIFHLVTHGFFKALLFLSAGSVIHATHEQNIFAMGGIRRKMPITYANFWFGSLAIIGIFPFAGFYSKDLVLESAFAANSSYGYLAFSLGMIAAVLTAIYSVKIIILTFHGKTNLSEDAFHHVHESPAIMNVPLILLLVGTAFAGIFGYYFLDIQNPSGYFDNVIHFSHPKHIHAELFIQILPLIAGLTGMLLGLYIYTTTGLSNSITTVLKPIYFIVSNKFFFDEIYHYLIVMPISKISQLVKIFDIKVIDYLGPVLFSNVARCLGWAVNQLQTGYIYNYTIFMIIPLVCSITFFVFDHISTIWSI